MVDDSWIFEASKCSTLCQEVERTMNRSIENKRLTIVQWMRAHPADGHPHYWCGGLETECDECNMDHPMTELHLRMLEEESELLQLEPERPLNT